MRRISVSDARREGIWYEFCIHCDFIMSLSSANLQSSRKFFETPMHVPFPLQCAMWVQSYVATTALQKGGVNDREQNYPKCFKVFVWNCSYILKISNSAWFLVVMQVWSPGIKVVCQIKTNATELEYKQASP